MGMNSITPPRTYSEWVDILDALMRKENDEEIVEAMHKGTIEWQSGVAERFSRKLIDVVNSRIDGAMDKFHREIGRAAGQERVIIQALLGLRKELRLMAKAINLPAIPEKDRDQYYQLVITHANNVQKSLEDSARRDRTGKLASIVRNNRVNSF